MTVPGTTIGRKERFKAALALSRMTASAWAAEHEISVTHLNEVLDGNRKSAPLTAAIDAFIDRHFPVA